MTEASRGNARLAETFLQLCRKDAANLAKLKHPNVVRLLEPFEETRSQLVMVTEAVTASLADVIKLRKASAMDGGRAGSLHLSELEIKHGFLQVQHVIAACDVIAALAFDPHKQWLSITYVTVSVSIHEDCMVLHARLCNSYQLSVPAPLLCSNHAQDLSSA